MRFCIRMLFQPVPSIIFLIKKYLLMSILNFSVVSFRPLLFIISSSENYLLYIYCYSEAIYKLWAHPSWIFAVIDYMNSAPSMSPLIISSLILLLLLFPFVFLRVFCCLPKWCHSFADKAYFLPMTEENEQRKSIFLNSPFFFYKVRKIKGKIL